MAWGALADLANVAVRDTFGATVTYEPVGGGTHALVAPFDRTHVDVQLSTEVGVTSTRPMLELRLADLAVEPQEGDQFVAGGERYQVEEVRLDGRGGAKLYSTVVG